MTSGSNFTTRSGLLLLAEGELDAFEHEELNSEVGVYLRSVLALRSDELIAAFAEQHVETGQGAVNPGDVLLQLHLLRIA